MKILHVTAHMGGGIGTVISGVCIKDKFNQHSILCLETCQDKRRLNDCLQNNIAVYQWADEDIHLLDQFDIVQVEWWHHPLTAKFMVHWLNQVKTRLVVWSHISGCNYPAIPYRFVNYPDAFVFATPYSYDNPYWSEREAKAVRQNSFVAVSSGNDFSGTPPAKKAHTGFCVGYVGFLGYEKTSPEFVAVCEACAEIPDVQFRVVGDLKYGQELYTQAMMSSCASLFDFRGFSTDVSQELTGFDVFACLLQKEHTGASENALLEAMYHQVCPVVFEQCTEQYLVKDGETGLVCKGPKEFAAGIKRLYQDPMLRERLARQASEYVRTHYSIRHTTEALCVAYDAVMKKEKHSHDGAAVFGDTPADWFLTCYMQDPKCIKGLAAGKSKGSIFQYYSYFKDKALKKIIQRSTI